MLKRRYILILLVMSIGCGFKLNSKSNVYAVSDNQTNIESFADERSYLQDMENADPIAIEKNIKESISSSKINDMLSEDAQMDFKEYFKDTIFIGDSITEYISEAEILPKSNVYAKKGNIVSKVNDDIEKLKYANPDRVIMLFGMNDVTNFQNVEEFKNEYKKVIKRIQDVLPNTRIYIESPTLIQDKAEDPKNGFTNENILLYKDAVNSVAEETSCIYVELTELISSGDYYEQDGIHFKYNFYESLFKYLRSYINKER